MTRYTKNQLDRMNLAGRQESGREMIDELKTMARDYMVLTEHTMQTYEAFRDSSIALAELIRHTGIELTDVPWVELTTRRVMMTDESLLVDWIIDNARGLARSLLTLREGGLEKLLTLSNMFPDAGMPISFAEREGWNIVWENLPGREDNAMQQFPDGSLVKITDGQYVGKVGKIKGWVPAVGEYLVAYGAKEFRIASTYLEAVSKPEAQAVAVEGFGVPVGVMGDSTEAAQVVAANDTSSVDADSEEKAG